VELNSIEDAAKRDWTATGKSIKVWLTVGKNVMLLVACDKRLGWQKLDPSGKRASILVPSLALSGGVTSSVL